MFRAPVDCLSRPEIQFRNAHQRRPFLRLLKDLANERGWLFTVDLRGLVHVEERFTDGFPVLDLVGPRNDDRQERHLPRSRIVDFVALKQGLADFVTVLDGGLNLATEEDLLRSAQSKIISPPRKSYYHDYFVSLYELPRLCLVVVAIPFD